MKDGKLICAIVFNDEIMQVEIPKEFKPTFMTFNPMSKLVEARMEIFKLDEFGSSLSISKEEFTEVWNIFYSDWPKARKTDELMQHMAAFPSTPKQFQYDVDESLALELNKVLLRHHATVDESFRQLHKDLAMIKPTDENGKSILSLIVENAPTGSESDDIIRSVRETVRYFDGSGIVN